METIKLIVCGDENETMLMSRNEYMNWLEVCTSIDFDTHLAIDVANDSELIQALTKELL